MINEITHGDCLQVMKDIPSKSVDMILCDLPYGTTACKWDSIIPFAPLWKQYKRIRKDSTAIVLTASQPFTTVLINSNFKEFKYQLIWDKMRTCGSMLAKIRPLKIHEDIVVFSKDKEKYNPQMRKGAYQYKATGGNSDNYGNINIIRNLNDDYYPNSIMSFLACHNMTGKEHPTQKPINLFRYLIRTYTNKGDLVLDNCSGSGTTALACHIEKRKFICIEKEKKYVELSIERLKTEQQKIRLEL